MKKKFSMLRKMIIVIVIKIIIKDFNMLRKMIIRIVIKTIKMIISM